MGRKRKEIIETTEPRDRIGEPVDFEKCPDCIDHTDCFACIDGKCTALKESGGADCIFYKPLEKAIMENKKIYMELRRKGRGDLIRAHAGVFAALGVFNDEIREADGTADDLDFFRTADYEKALMEAEKKLSETEEKAAADEDTGG